MILKAFLKHELLNLLKSQRIYTTVIIFIILFMSVFIARVIDYQNQVNQYLADVQDGETDLQNAANYSFVIPLVIHRPLLFSIYNQGFIFGRVINIEYFGAIDGSRAKNETRNRVFRKNQQLDITFLITFFLSLFILLISYDNVNGEKRTGTLRILMTYPVKRQSFILKKILGVFIFVAVVFTIPYLLSIMSLIFIYMNLLTSSFFLSAFFYWFLVLLFIFFFCLLGTFISCCTTNPSRSLVYSLLIWILFCIVLPTGWNQIISPKLFDNNLAQLRQIHNDKEWQAYHIFHGAPLEDNILEYGVFVGDCDDWPMFMRAKIWTFKEGHERYCRFQRYAYENYLPANRDVEYAVDNVIRKRINIEKIRSMVFFFDPIVLFNDIATKITGNNRADFLQFLQSAREIRDDLVSTGVKDGWLFGYGFVAWFAEKDMLGSEEYWDKKIETTPFSELYDEVMAMMVVAEPYSFEIPFIRKYEQPNPSFGEIFSHIAFVLGMFVISILTLWIMTWVKFLRFDVR